MSQVIAIAGGSGGLGRAVVEALRKHEKYSPIILARKANPALETEVGIPVLEADYSNPNALTQLLEQNKINTVISTIAGMDPSPEINLIKAADQSRTTQRFIPSIWSGFDYKPEHAKSSAFAAARLALLDAVKTTTLEWTAIFPGIFLDFYALAIPSHVRNNALAIDIAANAAAIPGNGTYPVPFTHTVDIAAYTAALLGVDKWAPKYSVVGDTKTWNEVVALAEKAKGVKFEVAYDAVEKLERGEITELPGHRAMYELFGGEAAKPAFQGMIAQSAVWMAEGQMRQEGLFLNEMFAEVVPVTVERAFGVV